MHSRDPKGSAFASLIALVVALPCFAATDVSLLQVQPEGPFTFAQKPSVTREGDRVTITFETKAFCDVTVAIEETGAGSVPLSGAAATETGTDTSASRRSQSPFSRIVRHLASGVLGPNAPEPFQRNAKRQTLVWDGKNDKGEYLDNKDRLRVRVSLGLDPKFERTLFHTPFKRYGRGTILMAADREGMYVYDDSEVETIRLYDHTGDYVRTVYPFPANKIEAVKALPRRVWPDGFRAPAKRGYFLATLLTGPESGGVASSMHISSESTAMTVRDGRLALVGVRLNRIGTDGTSGGLDLYGPHVDTAIREFSNAGKRQTAKKPQSVALSPDGNALYLTAYAWINDPNNWSQHLDWANAVYRAGYTEDAAPALFIGDDQEGGTDNAHFRAPADVAVDRIGRVYVADHFNNRVQVFSPDGKHLKTMPVEAPVKIMIHHETQEVYVASWAITGDQARSARIPKAPKRPGRPRLRRFQTFPYLTLKGEYPLSLGRGASRTDRVLVRGMQNRIALDSWADRPTFWLVNHKGGYPALLQERDGALVAVRDHKKDAERSRVPLDAAPWNRRRLYVDHTRNHLYLLEGKAANEAVRIDPETGRCEVIALPFGASDMVISPDGLVHLRTGSVVGRFDPETWREAPFDYGEERRAVWNYATRGMLLRGALPLPSIKTAAHWHHGGMDINARNELLVTCFNPAGTKMALRRRRQSREERMNPVKEEARPHATVMYPGRFAAGHELYVWDDRGRPLYEDILKGQPEMVAGVAIDVHGNIYANVAASMMWNGKPYFRVVGHRFDQVGTLIKFKPGAGRFIKADGTPVPLTARPDRPQDLAGFWVEGAEWIYPGVGRTQWGMDCSCWNSRICLDYFARSFAPEYDRFSVAVLDTNGNLITRIGTYGNVDDPGIALFDACYLATFTDRRLFIADAGNARIVSVRLNYHATERVPLKDVTDDES